MSEENLGGCEIMAAWHLLSAPHPPSLPADSRSAVGKAPLPQLTAIQNQLVHLNSESVNSADDSRQEDRGKKREECTPLYFPLCPPLCSAIGHSVCERESMQGGNIPLVAHYSLLGQWEGACY